MTILACTTTHIAEFEDGLLTIARYSDGQALGLTGKGIAGQFRACLKTHSAERTIDCYIRMAQAAHRRMIARPGYRSPFGSLDHRNADGWEPLYKPGRAPRPDKYSGPITVEEMLA